MAIFWLPKQVSSLRGRVGELKLEVNDCNARCAVTEASLLDLKHKVLGFISLYLVLSHRRLFYHILIMSFLRILFCFVTRWLVLCFSFYFI
jgi:hypothetical protein